MLSAREGQTYLSEILLGADEDLFMLGEIMNMNLQKYFDFFYCFVLQKMIIIKSQLCSSQHLWMS